MNKIRIWIIAINLLAVLSYFAVKIAGMEDVMENGTVVRLRLAPVDPRSIMQGDYMRLRYEVLNHCTSEHDKYVVVSVPDGAFIRTQKDKNGIADGEVALRVWHERYWSHLSSENYFFEEGTGSLFSAAGSALVVVDDDGNIYIKNLCDSDGNIIVPKSKIEKEEKDD